MVRRVFGCLVVKAIEPSVPSTSIDHVFMWPGATRLVSMRSGNSSPARSARQSSTALSGVSHGAGRPAVGTLAEDVGQHRAHVPRRPARPQREVQRVHAEVAHAAVARR